ncbi:MAG: VTT domain-containing protein [Hydrogenophaga sp.]|nr:VTT domain-containing protein [Hydrogenophaga sp.]
MKSLVKPLLLTGVLTLAFASLHLGWWGPVTEEVLLRDLFRQNGMVAWPVFVAGSVLYTALGGPRQVLAFSCGFLFGGWQGALIGTLLTGIGAMVTMFAVHQLGFEWVRQKHAQKIELIRAVLAEDTWIWMCVIRLIPVGSNLLTNVAAALSGLNPLAVLFGSMLGYLPQMALFSFAGSGIALHDSSQIWMSLVMLVLSTGLGLYLYHHGFKQRLRRFRQDHSHASAH